MKGLIKTSIIIAVLIVVGIATSVIVTSYLASRLAAAHEHGFEEGYTQGHMVGFREGSRIGYQEGSKIGYEKAEGGGYGSSYEAGFYFLYNPTYDEVQEVLAEGEMDSAGEIHDYAETNGIRTAYVRCQIAREAAAGMVYVLELVAFETVDNGIIIIEPWSYKEVKVEVGKGYKELNGLPTPSYDDTITEITIVW